MQRSNPKGFKNGFRRGDKSRPMSGAQAEERIQMRFPLKQKTTTKQLLFSLELRKPSLGNNTFFFLAKQFYCHILLRLLIFLETSLMMM